MGKLQREGAAPTEEALVAAALVPLTHSIERFLISTRPGASEVAAAARKIIVKQVLADLKSKVESSVAALTPQAESSAVGGSFSSMFSTGHEIKVEVPGTFAK